MTWNMLEILDASSGHPLYPTLSEASAQYPVELAPADGRVAHYRGKRVEVWETIGGSLKPQMNMPSTLKWDVLVTDARVVVYCEKFTRGNKHLGFGGLGAALALTADAVSAAKAARRRKGKLLAAHIRYPWVQQVTAAPAGGLMAPGLLRLRLDGAVAPGLSARNMQLEVAFGRDVDILAVANDVVHRIARHQLYHAAPTLSDEDRAAFTELVTVPTRRPEGRSTYEKPVWGRYDFPRFWRVNDGNSFPKGADPVGHLAASSKTEA